MNKLCYCYGDTTENGDLTFPNIHMLGKLRKALHKKIEYDQVITSKKT